MKLRVMVTLFVLLASPLFAERRRVVPIPLPPAEAARKQIVDAATLVADRTYATHQMDRRAWEDGIFMMGQTLHGEVLNVLSKGSGDKYIDRAVTYVGPGESYIAGANWTTYAQTALELYRYLPKNDPNRAGLLAAIQKPEEFAFTALVVSPGIGAPQSQWWIPGGYGTEFWVDDLYMIHAWLAMAGSVRDGLPGDPLMNTLAWEWWEAYIYNHRPNSVNPIELAVPSNPNRQGYFLWNPGEAVFYHDPSLPADFWGRGNGWAMYGLAYAAEYMTRPYVRGIYPETVTQDDLIGIYRAFAASLLKRRMPDGGWGTSLRDTSACPVSESSATALIAFGLAKGVNLGILDHDTYAPAVRAAYKILRANLNPAGDLANIQPGGDRPSCETRASNDPVLDMNFGPGAFLMLSSELAKFPDDDLAKLVR